MIAIAKEVKASTADVMGNPSTPTPTSSTNTVQGSNSWLYRTFLQYDLSSIPVNAILVSAKLKVYCYHWNDNASKGTTNISKVTEDWSEETLCWNVQPVTTGSYLTSDVYAPAVGTWSDWDITTLVQEWLDGVSPNYGLYIKNNNEGSYRYNWELYNRRAYKGAYATYIEVEYEMSKYLVRSSNGDIYTVVDSELTKLEEAEVTSSLFQEKGFDTFEWNILQELIDPEILIWKNGADDISAKANVIATPPHQVVVSQAIDLMHSSIKGIDGVSVDCKGNVLFAVSFDDKATWMQHNGTDWVNVADELTGMTELELEAITAEQWQSKYELSSDMYIRCTLLDETQSVTTVSVGFVN